MKSFKNQIISASEALGSDAKKCLFAEVKYLSQQTQFHDPDSQQVSSEQEW